MVIIIEKQKGYNSGTRGRGDLLYIDQHILEETKTRRKNVTMTRIDSKKAYGMVLQTWMIKCLKMYKIPNKVLSFIMETMKNWKVELTGGGKTLAEVKSREASFQETCSWYYDL